MNQTRGMRYGAAIMVVAGALTGCSLGPKQTEQAATYDLGSPRAATRRRWGYCVTGQKSRWSSSALRATRMR